MTDREREIFKMIEANPLISQGDIASRLNITRTSVGVHISNLVKKGYIMGKGYIMAYAQPVTVIGGANVDIQGKPVAELLMADSNPGHVKTSLGGVGRNIAENLTRLGMPTRLVTAVGDDKEGLMVMDNARELGMDMEDTIVSNKDRTSIYLYILDEVGEMVTAVADMDVVKRLTPNHLRKLLPKLENSPYVVLDANLPADSIQFLAENLKETRLIFDPVSVAKSTKIKGILNRFYALKLNRLEAQSLTGMPITTKEEAALAAKYLVEEQGVAKVFITLGKDGVCYRDKEGSIMEPGLPVKVENATGAGDAFTAAMVYAMSEEMDREAMVAFCLGASGVTLMDHKAISGDLSVESIEELLRKY